MEKTTVTGKGVIQLPYALREKYGILDGGMALLVEQPDGILIKKLDAAFFDAFLGKWADELPARAEFQAWNQEEIQADEARFKVLP